jgi:hypothetical protein
VDDCLKALRRGQALSNPGRPSARAVRRADPLALRLRHAFEPRGLATTGMDLVAIRASRLDLHRPPLLLHGAPRPRSGALHRSSRQSAVGTSRTTLGPCLSGNRSSTPDSTSRRSALRAIPKRRELEEDKHVIRVVRAPKDALCGRSLSGTRSVLLEHRPPGVVVANLEASDDERRHVTPFAWPP